MVERNQQRERRNQAREGVQNKRVALFGKRQSEHRRKRNAHQIRVEINQQYVEHDDERKSRHERARALHYRKQLAARYYDIQVQRDEKEQQYANVQRISRRHAQIEYALVTRRKPDKNNQSYVNYGKNNTENSRKPKVCGFRRSACYAVIGFFDSLFHDAKFILPIRLSLPLDLLPRTLNRRPRRRYSRASRTPCAANTYRTL